VYTRTQAGALAAFLRELLMTDTPYATAIEADFAHCTQQHFHDMPGLVPKGPGSSVVLPNTQPVAN
jgi:hypothetical protein